MEIDIRRKDEFYYNFNISENIRLTLEQLDVLRVIVFFDNISRKKLTNYIFKNVDIDAILHILRKNKFIEIKRSGIGKKNIDIIATKRGIEEKFLLTELIKNYLHLTYKISEEGILYGNLFFIKQLIEQSIKQEKYFIKMKIDELHTSNDKLSTKAILNNITASNEDIFEALNEFNDNKHKI